MLDSTTRDLIALGLREDLGPGDVTSQLIPTDRLGQARFVAKTELVLAGTEAVIEVFRQVDPSVRVHFTAADGAWVAAGHPLGRLEGPARSLLGGERVALNLFQRMSGIATMARRASDLVAGTKTKIVDTRKTTPGLRSLEKHAVRMGGGFNHRFGLFDGILIKDNHIAAAGGVAAAIAAARASNHHLLKIECEVDTLEQLDEALAAGAEVILLDNMSTADMREAVSRTAGRALLEASGNMTLERLPEVAQTGVDLISMGALTHTVTAADISLDWMS